MTCTLAGDIETWESEGGATPDSHVASAALMTGTPPQVEWAERIKLQVKADFDRVAASFRSIAAKLRDDKRADTEAVSRFSRTSELK